MTIDTNALAELPCARRWLAKTAAGEACFCRPASTTTTVPFAEAIRRPHPNQARPITPEICRACTQREEPLKPSSFSAVDPKQLAYTPPKILKTGVIIYQKTVGVELPPVPAGYRRKSDDPTHEDAFVMVPDMPPCAFFRLVPLQDDACRCIRLTAGCSKPSDYEGNCSACLAKGAPVSDGHAAAPFDKRCGGCPGDLHEDVLANLPPILFDSRFVPGNPLQALEYTLPPDDGRKRAFPRPKFHADGSIEYPPETVGFPPQINGYQRDEANPLLFHPLWVPCTLRQQGAQLKPDGSVHVVMVCNNPQAPTSQSFVPQEVCRGCPHRKS